MCENLFDQSQVFHLVYIDGRFGVEYHRPDVEAHFPACSGKAIPQTDRACQRPQ
jgi:hypothetical protein